MATCHSLRLVDGELVGDPLDLKMFEFTRWSYQEEGKKARGSGEANGDHGMATGISPPVVRPPPDKGTLSNGDLYDEAPTEVSVPSIHHPSTTNIDPPLFAKAPVGARDIQVF